MLSLLEYERIVDVDVDVRRKRKYGRGKVLDKLVYQYGKIKEI
jgi:hypothetical protein